MSTQNPQSAIRNPPSIEFAADFWNCECADNYIHVAGVHDCPRCGVVQDIDLKSTVDEVVMILGIERSQIKRVGE